MEAAFATPVGRWSAQLHVPSGVSVVIPEERCVGADSALVV